MMIQPPPLHRPGLVPSSIGSWVNQRPIMPTPRPQPLGPISQGVLMHPPIPHPQLPNHTLVPVHNNDLQRIINEIRQGGAVRY